MTNKEIREMLQNIKKLLNNKENGKAIEYIEEKTTQLFVDEDLASEYMDDLVKTLK